MNKEELARMVAELLQNMKPEPMVKGSDYKPDNSGPQQPESSYSDGEGRRF